MTNHEAMTNRTTFAHTFDSHLNQEQPAEQLPEPTVEAVSYKSGYANRRPQIRVTDPLVQLISLASRPWRWRRKTSAFNRGA